MVLLLNFSSQIEDTKIEEKEITFFSYIFFATFMLWKFKMAMPCKKLQVQNISGLQIGKQENISCWSILWNHCPNTANLRLHAAVLLLYCKYLEKGNKILGILCVESVFQYGSHFHILGSLVWLRIILELECGGQQN